MNALNREFYINRMKPYYKTWHIKILAGMRGVGKTGVFQQVINELKQAKEADDFHILYFNFDYLEYAKFRNPEFLEEYIRGKIIDTNYYYVFFDEIQNILGFESMVRSLISDIFNISIFVSCSTARCFPRYLGEDLQGRIRIFYMTPFSYMEACSFLGTDYKMKNMFLNYLKYGGMPARFQYKKTSEVKSYLYSVLDLNFFRSVVMSMRFYEVNYLFMMLQYISKYIGKLFPFTAIVEELSKTTPGFKSYQAENALDALYRCLVVMNPKDYNVITNQPLAGCSRYYFSDLGFAFVIGLDMNRKENLEAMFKNLVYLELRRLGYIVYTGYNMGNPLDFVAFRGEFDRIYVQVHYLLEDRKAVNDAIKIFDGITDNYPKYIVSMNRNNLSRKGIIHKFIFDFLNDEEVKRVDELA